MRQRFSDTQGGQVPPPQSWSVSLPFSVPSVQLLALQNPERHTFDEQSPEESHPWPLPHAGHAPPPQSTSVSVPFFLPSSQAGAWHLPFAHELLAQSLSAAHPCDTAHLGQLPPPQSTSVSPAPI